MKQTQSEKLATRNARANRIRREIGHQVGSPYRIHEITEAPRRFCDERSGGCGASVTEVDIQAGYCTNCHRKL